MFLETFSIRFFLEKRSNSSKLTPTAKFSLGSPTPLALI